MKKVIKALVLMYLPQSSALRNDNKKLYSLFRSRALKKSNDNYIDKGRKPVLMILNINHPMMEVQVGVIVTYNSFNIIKNDLDEEIGFSVDVYQPFDSEKQVLTVYKMGKAFIENKKKLEKALKKKNKN